MSNHTAILQEATQNHHITTMSEEYVAVNLTFSMPQQTKKDRRAQHDAEQANNAHGAILARRRLWSKETMAPFHSIAAATRAYLEPHTTRVGADQLLHKTLIDTVMHEVNYEYFIKWDQHVIKFGQDYTNILREAEKQQGRLFDASVYTDVQNITSQFRRTFDMYGIGNVGAGIFKDLEASVAEDVAKAVHETTMRNMETALKTPMSRLVEVVMNIHNKTARTKGSRIHDNVMGDLEELTAIMPQLNVVNLDYLNDMAARCRQELLAPTEEIQNKDSGRRAEVAERAGEILEEFGIDPDINVQIKEPKERKDTAKFAAEEILSQMKGFF